MTKEQAIKAGRALLRRMRGKGWKVSVWENIGWHYSVVSGPVSLSPVCGGRFMCLISDSPDRAGSGLASWTEHGAGEKYMRDPNKAVRRALRYMRDVIERYDECLQAASDAAGMGAL